MWWMMQNFVAQVIQLLKHWLCDGSSVLSGYVMAVGRGHGKNWAHSVDQCQLQALQFSASIALLSLLLNLNAFAGIQKALVDQTSSRPPDSDNDLGSALELLLDSGHCWLYKIHFLLHVTI